MYPAEFKVIVYHNELSDYEGLTGLETREEEFSAALRVPPSRCMKFCHPAPVHII
jgi:hypothetical protein